MTDAETTMGEVRDAIERPIFVIGTGRSGTTLFFHLLALHPDLAWFSNFGNRWYRHAWPALLSRIRDAPEVLTETTGGCALRANRAWVEELAGRN